ncbi:hypothetical protein [Paenibacillus polymyxa]|uniref:Phage ABA sandwich domain-containing protein n=1 Tax=Paenibacillus polymyxa (strain SC2) TaxID=886882 RepID=E3EKF7_PAEPS|nr:hypothetical protein [Paenibacillus polymyxa]ADO59789.1 hypothetical protein PPSC2_26215 [Paenibacillus polymyxa SC2]WPQ59975.1 hypothetical protein SKN87_27415 [Paenibacillus polymyxa]
MVKDMTDQQLNRWLAEYMGYTISEYKNKWGWLMCPNGDNVHESLFPLDELWGFVPDYCTDPAASLEVQAAAVAENYEEYVYNLNGVIYKEYECMTFKVISAMLTATPRQRAEAAYMTLSIRE